MNPSIHVERANWAAFAKAFNHAHDGWGASLEVRDADGGLEVVVDDRPFRGIIMESGEAPSLVLTFGDDPDEHLAHIVERPHAIIEIPGENESERTLVIDEEDGTGCVLQLESPFTER